MAQPKQIIKLWDKHDFIKRPLFEKWATAQGYELISEEEVNRFSGLKALILGAFFLPLALFGFNKKVRCVYERR